VKPDASSQGKGIFITRRVEEIPIDKCHVVQAYIRQPYLIDGFKFDFRVYVLITQVLPDLVCYVYEEGLGRFATEKYDTKFKDEHMYSHLTNYSLNKQNEKADPSEFKRTLSSVYQVTLSFIISFRCSMTSAAI